MKKRECPHMSECKQLILKHDFVWKCLGKISWNQENCFKSNAIGITEMRRLPNRWWAIKLIDTYEEIKRNETTLKSNAELEHLHSVGEGLIYNDFSHKGPSGKKYNILHAAYCHWILISNVNVPKYFFSDIDKAIAWLRKNRGEEGKNWKRCGTCKAKARRGRY